MSDTKSAMSPAEPPSMESPPVLAPGSRGLTWVLALVCIIAARWILGGFEFFDSRGLGDSRYLTLALEQQLSLELAQRLLPSAAVLAFATLALAVLAIRGTRSLPIRLPLWGIAAAQGLVLGLGLLSWVIGVGAVGDATEFPRWMAAVPLLSYFTQWACVLWIAEILGDGRWVSLSVTWFGALPSCFLWLGIHSPEMVAASAVGSIVSGIALLRAVTPNRHPATTMLPEVPWKNVARGLLLMRGVMLGWILFAIAAATLINADGPRTALVAVIGGGSLLVSAMHLRSLWLCARAPLASGAPLGFGTALFLAAAAVYIEVFTLAFLLQHGGGVGELISMAPVPVYVGAWCITLPALYRLIDHLEPGQAAKKMGRVLALALPGIAMFVVSGLLIVNLLFMTSPSGGNVLVVIAVVMLPAATVLILWSFGRMVALLRSTANLIESRLGLPAAHLEESEAAVHSAAS